MTLKINKTFVIPWLEIIKWGIFFVMMFSFLSCGLKKPKDEIGPLKTVISRYERGVFTQNKAVLDSVYSRKEVKRDSLISSIVIQFSSLKTSKGMGDLHFARRRFSVIENKDSANVELILGGEKLKEERVLRVYLKKKRGEWKVVGQSMD